MKITRTVVVEIGPEQYGALSSICELARAKFDEMPRRRNGEWCCNNGMTPHQTRAVSDFLDEVFEK